MNDRWLYMLPEGLANPDGQWPTIHWQAGPLEVRPASLAEAGQVLRGMPVVLVLPMEMFGWCLTGPLPGRRRPGAQTLAFAVEEQLGEPLEPLHLAFGAARADRRVPVLSTDRQRLKTVLALVQEQGIDPVAVYADADLLPSTQPGALWLGGRWLLGGDLEGRLALSPADARTLLPSLPPMQWWGDSNTPQGLPKVKPITHAQALLVNGRITAIDLRQGEFRRRRRELPWAGLSLSVIALGVLVCLFDYLRAEHLQARATQLHGQSVQRFQSLYPDQTRVVDLAAQFRARQQQDRIAQKTRLQQLSEVSERVVEAGNIRIERAELQVGLGWQMEVLVQDFADLERLRERMPSLTVGNATKTQSGVRANLSWGES